MSSPARVRRDVPEISAGVLNRARALVVFHLQDAVEAHPSRLDGALVDRHHIADVEMDRRRHRLPLRGGTANLDHTPLDAETGMEDLPRGLFPMLPLQFLRTERAL